VWPHEDWQVWVGLQRDTVERVHPSWLPSLAAELVVAARCCPAGRRILAGQLYEFAPVLFGLPLECRPAAGPERSAPARRLGETAWLRTALQEPVERALDLGSLALAPRLRTVVTRSAVAQLRTLLGAKRYERILNGHYERLSGHSGGGSGAASPEWTGGLPLEAGAGDLGERLTRRGAAELEAYAASVHPAFAESVRLSFHRAWWPTQPHVLSLATEVVERCLRLASEPGGGCV
jgi:hypothetical protein